MPISQKITPFLWFDHQAEEAAQAQRVTAALLQMKKLDIAALQRAAAGEG